MADFQDIYGQVQGFVGDEHAETLVLIKQWINEAVRDVWVAHEWPFKRATLRLNTVAPYTTGTIDATLGSTTITISGGSLTGLEGYKFALSVGAPFSRLVTIAGDGLSATLDTAFTQASVSGEAFVVYKDEYDLGSTVESLEAMNLLSTAEQGMRYVPLLTIERFESLPSTMERPSHYYLAAPLVGTNNIVIGLRAVPDGVYPIDVRYERRPTDMVDDTDTPSLPDEFTPLIVSFALYKASLYAKAQFNSQVAYAEYQRGLAQKVKQIQARTAADFQFMPFDAGGSNRMGHPWPQWF